MIEASKKTERELRFSFTGTPQLFSGTPLKKATVVAKSKAMGI
jgi:hypothetical protein